MNITLIQEQMAYIELALETEDEFEVYGGTTRAPFEFIPTGLASWRVIVRESEVAGAAIRPFDIYARQRSSEREWVVLSGKIIVKPRTADIEGDKLSPVEYHVSVPVVDSVVETQGMAIVTGIPGPQGPKGDKGEPGEGGMTSEERATLAGAAQRDADNTFTAGNTFTGAVDMSGAQVTPPEGWNVGELTPEAIQAVAPIAWGVYEKAPTVDTTGKSIALGESCETKQGNAVAIGQFGSAGGQGVAIGYIAKAEPMNSVAIGCLATAAGTSVSIGKGCESSGTNGQTISIGADAKSKAPAVITIGSQFTENVNGQNVINYCQTQGTGSITIGAGANTLNNGDVESSNSITIGCKASNTAADSVVIGAQASGTSAFSVSVGGLAQAKGLAVAVGRMAKAVYTGTAIGAHATSTGAGFAGGFNSSAVANSIAIGHTATATADRAIVIGKNATVSDYGATVIRSTAEDGTYTQLYFSGANTPLANTYHGGAPMLGYVTKDSAGNIVAAGTRSLIDLLTDNSTFAPASLDENGEWVMPKVFHPSDLDLPQEEPSEVEEYQPLPVYPIVEPSEDELRTPTQEI